MLQETVVPKTAEEGRNAAGSISAQLGQLGLSAGDRVVISIESSWLLVAATWACISRRLIPVPVDPRLSPSELAVILGQVSPALVLDDTALLERWLANQPEPVTDVPACRPMHFTSGTTGTPKGVWSGWWTDAEAVAALAEERDLWGFRSDDLNLAVSPLYHSAPLRFAFHTWLAGGTVAVMPRFDARSWWKIVERLEPTTMFCVPTHLQRIQQGAPADAVETGSSFRLIAHAGAACPDKVRHGAYALFGPDVVWEFYGSTEGQFTACSGSEWLVRGSGVGKVRPGRSMFSDENDQLWCVVPRWAEFEYWSDDLKTSDAWRSTDSGPAFSVGDLGEVSPDGWVHIFSRRTDLIISGGVNVYPAEVEEALMQLAGVREAAVYALPDDEWGQIVCASIVGDDVTEEALRAHSQKVLAPPKRPKTYRFVDDLPRTATGKVRRRELQFPL